MKQLVSAPALAVILLLGVTCFWNVPSFSEESADDASNDQFFGSETGEGGVSLAELSDSFRDKVLMVEIDRSNALESRSGSAVLKDARILLIGDRYFVQGTGYAPADSDHWAKDSVVGLSWENVNRYYVMSAEQFDNFSTRYSKSDNRDYE